MCIVFVATGNLQIFYDMIRYNHCMSPRAQDLLSAFGCVEFVATILSTEFCYHTFCLLKVKGQSAVLQAVFTD